MSVTILQLHKRSVYQFKNIQDKFSFNEEKKCFALSDGTTQSFKSETWAEILTKQFVLSPTFEYHTLIQDFANRVDEFKKIQFEFSSNYAIASLEKTKQLKGGTATFMGLQIVGPNRFNVICCGDTNLFIIAKDKLEYFPYSDVESLDRNNHFINTENLVQNKIYESFFQSKSFTYQNNDILVLATDALSRLLLKQPHIISELTAINDFEALRKFCLTYWDKKELEEDDISAIIIKNEVENKVNRVLPPADFSFPKEEKINPKPDTDTQDNLNTLIKMNMQEIKQQVSGLANDLHQVKLKIKFVQNLLITAVGIGIINLMALFYFRPTTVKIEPKNQQLHKVTSIVEGLKKTIGVIESKIESLEKRIPNTTEEPGKIKEDDPKFKKGNLPKTVKAKLGNHSAKPKDSKDSVMSKLKSPKGSLNEK